MKVVTADIYDILGDEPAVALGNYGVDCTQRHRLRGQAGAEAGAP